MYKCIVSILLFIFLLTMENPASSASYIPDGKKDSIALLIIDIQDFYFDGNGRLEGCVEASLVAKRILEMFRDKNLPVIHVMHGTKSKIHVNVLPIEGEKVIVKNEINSFRGTDLLEYLHQKHIKKLIICGMMTHMCLEGTTRAAVDYGFDCTVIADACATRDLKFGNEVVKARDVHISTLATLTYYAKVITAEEFLKDF